METNFVVGEKVKFLLNGNLDLGNQSEVVEITKTAICIEFKNGESFGNGEIMKFNKKTLKQTNCEFYHKNTIEKIKNLDKNILKQKFEELKKEFNKFVDANNFTQAKELIEDIEKTHKELVKS